VTVAPRMVCPDHCDSEWREALARELGETGTKIEILRMEVSALRDEFAKIKQIAFRLAVIVAGIAGAAQLPQILEAMR
jgi:hypothetical protein